MKILLTVHQFLPEHWSGTEVLTLDTARELRKLGHDVSIVTGYPCEDTADDDRFDEYEYDGIPVTRFKHSIGPIGGQNNTTESEYNNWLVAGFFRKFLRQRRPDVIHFFHLFRLSASIVDACYELKLPMVLTPTDFWFLCPTCQLRLPDNSRCQGPEPLAVNCLRHIVTINQPPELQTKIARIPDWALSLGIRAVRGGLFGDRWFSGQVRALSERPEFLRERLNKIDRVLVPTRLMQGMLTKHGLRPEKIVFSPYGINLEHLAEVIHRPSPKLRVGFIGTLSEHKGLQILLAAVRSLPQLQDLEVKVYGRRDVDPGFVQMLEEMAQGEPRVRFCDSFPNHEIGNVMGALDVLVVPSIWFENAPLVVSSAQAAGLPVIASNTPGLAEVIRDEVDGLLFEAGNVAALGNVLTRIAADPQLLPRLAGNARRPKSVVEYAQEVSGVYGELAREYANVKAPSPFPILAGSGSGPAAKSSSMGSPSRTGEWID